MSSAMDLSNFEVLKEDDDNYVIGHPKGKSITISKKGMSDKAHSMIKKMCSGGTAHYDEGTPDAPVSQADIPEALRPSPEPMPVIPQVDLPQAVPSSGGATGDLSVPAQNQTTPMNPQDIVAGKQTGVEGALQSEKLHRTEEAQALAGGQAAEAKALADTQKQIAAMPTQQDIMNQNKAKGDALFSAFQNQSLDPNRVFHNMSTGSKIATGIALFLGGIGSGLTHQANPAALMLQNTIDNDIEAQRNDQGKALNAWKMNREALGSDLAANLATKEQAYIALKYKLQQAATQSANPAILAKAAQGNDMIDQQIEANRFQRSLIQQGMGIGQNGNAQGGYAGEDPSILVPQLIKEPGAQKAAFEEIGRAQNVSRNGPKMMEAFDNAANKLHTVDFVPGMENRDQKAFHQLLLPNFKTIDGTVRQAAMDETFQNLTPQFGDSKKTIETKRNALEDWMTSESSAPTAKGHGIDLSKFRSTAHGNMGPVATKGGQQYKFVKGNR